MKTNKQRKLEFIRFKNKVRLREELFGSFKVSNTFADDTEQLDEVIKSNINYQFENLNKRIKSNYNYEATDVSFNCLIGDFEKDLTTFKIRFKRK